MSENIEEGNIHEFFIIDRIKLRDLIDSFI